MLVYEINITHKSTSFLVPKQIVTQVKELPKVCRLLQFARVTGADFEVNILEKKQGSDMVSVLPLLSSKTYRELDIL